MTTISYLLNEFFNSFSHFYFIKELNKYFPYISSFFLYCIIVFILIFVSFMLIIALYEWIETYNDNVNNPYYVKVYNSENKQTLLLPLTYKIYSFSLSIIKCIFYFSFSILLFIIIRKSTINKHLDINNLVQNIDNLPFILKVSLPLLLVLYLIIVVLFFKNIYARLFLELKRVYIYMLQFGGDLDPNSNYYFFYNRYDLTQYFVKAAYIRTFFLEFIEYYSVYDIHLQIYQVTDKTVPIIDWCHAKKYIVKILVPLLYLLRYSKYKDTFLCNILRYLLDQLHKGFWTFLKTFPLFIISCFFVFQYIFNNGIIKHFYLILFILYFYNLYLNFIYFLAHRDEDSDCAICFYYYKLDYLKNVTEATPYMDTLSQLFNDTTNIQNSALLDIYMKNDLNYKKTIAIYNQREWPLITSDIGIWYNKRISNIFNSKVVIYLILKCNQINNYILNKN